MPEIILHPIGTVRSPIRDPSRDEFWGGIVSTIDLDRTALGPAAAKGLSDFSHIEVLYHFHRVEPAAVERGARRPKGRADWPETGILAQRAKRRPNRIGLCVCRLLKVEGLRLTVSDLDAIDGSPVLDIKPYMRGFGPKGEIREPRWASELMATYFAG